MKVGFISFHSFLLPTGVKNHILGLHKEFQKRGIQSKIIVPRRTQSENYGKDVILLGTSFPLKFSGSQADFSINFNPLAIREVLEKEKFDVLHFHNCGLSTAQISIESHALNILTFHADVSGSEFLKNFPIVLFIMEKIVQWRADGIIGIAPFNLKPFKNYKGPKAVIPNGVDLEDFNPNVPKLKSFQDGKINLLFVGRIEERKGLIYLLKAYKILEKKFPNLRLLMVGEGPLKKECQAWTKEHRLREVHFLGEKTGKELPSYYTSSDIFVSPAIFGESFGIVLLEAMACGLPVAGFANLGYKTFMKGKPGERFFAKPKNFRALAEKLAVLIQDENIRKEMGEWGLKEAQNYSWPEIADRVLNFYKLCLKDKKRRPRKQIIVDKLFKRIYNSNIVNWLKKPI